MVWPASLPDMYVAPTSVRSLHEEELGPVLVRASKSRGDVVISLHFRVLCESCREHALDETNIERGNGDLNVDDIFGTEPRNSCRPDVVDPKRSVAERFTHIGRNDFELSAPTFAVVDDDDCPGWHLCEA